MLIFHGHSLLGQIREFFAKSYDSALDAYLKALWIASWSRDIPIEYHARTLHRIGALKGATGKAGEARDLLRQALIKYRAAGISPDHPTAANCHELFQQYDAAYWSAAGANEDSWSSIGGVSDRRVPLPRIHEEPDTYSIDSSVNTAPRRNPDRRPSHHAPSSSAHPPAGDFVQFF
jgi:tetratricopeptide (TPR) repeat protein